MKFFKNFFKSHYLIGTLYYTFPNLFSIIISLISIPIFLKFTSQVEYANYLISHFVLTISIITNLNFNKIAIKIINKKPKISKPYINSCKNGLKWMTLNSLLNQIYNYFDKYIIKIFLDSSAFIFYNISQQITSKFSSPIMSYNNIFIVKKKKFLFNEKKV